MHIFMDFKFYDTCKEIGVNKYLLMWENIVMPVKKHSNLNKINTGMILWPRRAPRIA